MRNQQAGFWEKLGEKRFAPGEGVTGAPPQSGWKRFFFVLATHFWKLISLNLLLLVFSVPLITVPAAFCGVNRVLIKLYREGNCFVWTEFWKEYRANLWKAIPFGAIGGACLFAGYYFLSFGTSALSNGVEVISTALGLLLAMFAVLYLTYVFVLLPALDLPNRQIARNAFILLITEWKTNGILLLSAAVSVVFHVVLFPYSLAVLALISLALTQYIACAAVNQPLQRRIIGPYEANNANANQNDEQAQAPR